MKTSLPATPGASLAATPKYTPACSSRSIPSTSRRRHSTPVVDQHRRSHQPVPVGKQRAETVGLGITVHDRAKHQDLGAELERLVTSPRCQLAAADAVRETEVVLDPRARPGLAARGAGVDDERGESFRGAVHGRREPRRARAHDGEVVLRKRRPSDEAQHPGHVLQGRCGQALARVERADRDSRRTFVVEVSEGNRRPCQEVTDLVGGRAAGDHDPRPTFASTGGRRRRNHRPRIITIGRVPVQEARNPPSHRGSAHAHERGEEEPVHASRRAGQGRSPLRGTCPPAAAAATIAKPRPFWAGAAQPEREQERGETCGVGVVTL